MNEFSERNHHVLLFTKNLNILRFETREAKSGSVKLLLQVTKTITTEEGTLQDIYSVGLFFSFFFFGCSSLVDE